LVQSSADRIIWTFVVDGVLHGSVARIQPVSSARDGASCGVSFAIGSRYQVVASSGAQGLQAGLCSRTMLLSTARPPETPAAGAAAGSAIGVAFGLLGIAGVTLIALLVLVRSRRPVHDVTGK